MRKATWWEKFWFNGDSIDIFVFLKEALKEVKECPEGYYYYTKDCSFPLSYNGVKYHIELLRRSRLFGLDDCTITIYKEGKYVGFFNGPSYLSVIDNYLLPLKNKKKDTQKRIDKQKKKNKKRVKFL